MKYDVDHFLAKFSAIPEEMWTTDKFIDPVTGACCALGHCGEREELGKCVYLEANALSVLFRNSFIPSVDRVNDGENSNYQQPTPKQRILAALNDIKNK